VRAMLNQGLFVLAPCLMIGLGAGDQTNESRPEEALSAVSFIEIGRPLQEQDHPPLPPAISSEEIQGSDFGSDVASALGAEAAADVINRRRLGLPIPEEYYEQCHFWVNAVRAREGLPGLRRWTEFESCSDEMSAYDFVEYRDKRRPHAAIQDRVGCDFRNSGATSWSQNSCPMWPNDVGSNEGCTVAMWNEKVTPGVDPNTMDCLSGVSSDCGHYYNLRGGSKPGVYNKYDRVACGFYVDPDTGKLYINQNFGGGSNFLCGGDSGTRPSGDVLVEDCTEATPDYSSCLVAGVEPLYKEYGCDYKDCDITYAGPCENQLTQGFDACSHFNIEEPSDCGGQFSVGSGTWFEFSDVCRASCNTCACEATTGPGATRSPTPAPTAPCDENFTGVCEDKTFMGMPVCQMLGVSGPCSPNHMFTTGGTEQHSVLEYCRASCQACACEAGDELTPSPTPSPTAAPSASPTSAPTNEPTSAPTASPTSAPTNEQTFAPTGSPTVAAVVVQGCKAMSEGIPKGKKTKVEGKVTDPCVCEAACSDFLGFVHWAAKKKCWCMVQLKVKNGKPQVTTTSNANKIRNYYIFADELENEL